MKTTFNKEPTDLSNAEADWGINSVDEDLPVVTPEEARLLESLKEAEGFDIRKGLYRNRHTTFVSFFVPQKYLDVWKGLEKKDE